MRKIRSRHVLSAIGAVTLLSLAGCIDDAGTGAKTATTLAPLVQNTFVTLAPDPTTTVPAPITAAPTPGATNAPGVTTAPGETTTTAAETADQSAETDPTTPAPASGGGQTYTVVAADTVFGIARTYGLSPQALATLNNWSEGINHPLFPGDKIQIPAGAKAATTTTSTSGSAASTTTTTAATDSGETYTVVAGDYLAGIASKNGTTVQAIVSVNGWSDGADHLIIPGQVIKLPAQSG